MTTKTKKKTARKTQPSTEDAEQAPPFEDALKELDVIVERMEDGEQTLEQSLQDFEKGMNLARQCEQQLKTAEARVDKLMAATEDAETVDVESAS